MIDVSVLKHTWADLPIGPLRYRITGEGPTLLFVHGLLVDSRLWDPVAARLAERYQVVLPDLPLGSHTRPVRDRSLLTPAAVADTLVALIDHLGLDDAALVGVDTGGGLAQIATAAHPDRVSHLVLGSCEAFEHFPPALLRPLKLLVRLPGGMQATVALLGNPALQRWPFPLSWVAKHPMDPELVRSWGQPARTDAAIRADGAAFIGAVHAAATLAAAEALHHWDKPALITWSREDRIFPLADAYRLADLLPWATLTFVDDAYTFASLDQPEALTELIVTFLASAGQGKGEGTDAAQGHRRVPLEGVSRQGGLGKAGDQ